MPLNFYGNEYLFHQDNWDADIEDFKFRVARCIDRRNFIALHEISPDVLHLALLSVFRENPEALELTDYEKDNLEELLWTAIRYIVSTTFISPREVTDYLRDLGNRMLGRVAGTQAQKNLRNFPKW